MGITTSKDINGTDGYEGEEYDEHDMMLNIRTENDPLQRALIVSNMDLGDCVQEATLAAMTGDERFTAVRHMSEGEQERAERNMGGPQARAQRLQEEAPSTIAAELSKLDTIEAVRTLREMTPTARQLSKLDEMAQAVALRHMKVQAAVLVEMSDANQRRLLAKLTREEVDEAITYMDPSERSRAQGNLHGKVEPMDEKHNRISAALKVRDRVPPFLSRGLFPFLCFRLAGLRVWSSR